MAPQSETTMCLKPHSSRRIRCSKPGVATARFIVQTLVGAHYLAYIGFLNQGFKGRKIGFVQIRVGSTLLRLSS